MASGLSGQMLEAEILQDQEGNGKAIDRNQTREGNGINKSENLL